MLFVTKNMRKRVFCSVGQKTRFAVICIKFCTADRKIFLVRQSVKHKIKKPNIKPEKYLYQKLILILDKMNFLIYNESKINGVIFYFVLLKVDKNKNFQF